LESWKEQKRLVEGSCDYRATRRLAGKEEVGGSRFVTTDESLTFTYWCQEVNYSNRGIQMRTGNDDEELCWESQEFFRMKLNSRQKLFW